MKMYPPAQVNKMMTDARNHWLMVQPTKSTIPIPDGVKVPKDISGEELTGMIGEWQKADELLKITTTSPSIQDYPIDDNLRELMVREFMAILAYNGYSSAISGNKLTISKERWSMEIENILQQMPFADYLPHQINRAYEHYKQKLNESLLECRREDEKEYDRLVHGNDHLYPYEAGWTMASKEVHAEQQRELNRSHGEDGYPSRERLESIRQTIIDNTEGEL